MASWRVTLDREQFRRLVAGREVVAEAGPAGDSIVLNLDLDFVPGMQRWTDPPEAEEFYAKSRRQRQDD
jgi:hypothetical protein